MSPMELEQEVIGVLRTIFDPEMPVNIYELGLIYGVKAEPEGQLTIRMTLTAPNCPVADALPAEVKTKVEAIPGVKQANVDLVFDPPWNKTMMSDAAKLELGMEDLTSIEGMGR